MDASPFGRLSPEIRNRIYKLAFDEEPTSGPDPPALGVYTLQPAVALTQTCRLIRRESRAMFYFGKAIFFVIRNEKHAIALRNFLDVLGADIVCNLYGLKMIINPEGHLWTSQRKIVRFSTNR